MTVSFKLARDFVYSSGTLWERALFGYLFEDRPLAQLHQSWLGYKNPDSGWGHALEHDIRTPDSHPLALEFLLSVLRITGVPAGSILSGTAEWVEQNRCDDGSLKNPASLLDYPHAEWWNNGGQTMPDSIVGNLIQFGFCTRDLADSTRRWVEQNLTLDKIKANEWLFMAYHAHDYFMHVQDFPTLEQHREATIQNIIECAVRAPVKQYSVLFHFACEPEGRIARAVPPAILQRNLDYVEATQWDDGCWSDEHGLAQWYPLVTIYNLLTLKRYGLMR
jgi:hypothetical protein